MILLDTNVLSELMKAEPAPRVLSWIDGISAPTLFIPAITQAEILYGVSILPIGKRRDALANACRTAFEEIFMGRILPFDSSAAEAYADIAASHRQSGRPISQADAQIAAIARSRGAALATRNVADFEGCGIEVVNPWGAVS
ncbi:plasmid stabilization protein [Paramagnetospirillum marisnigri]|uniref:Ribonuclease VapC n=1 Tax=Paramagnetospirillum marisnigri TaxID=1285242 RepID=A0A178MU69_9PROT|nr:type II toxin-antitoxin system VapC family toxin [Paramagnetospirillum marisnigri]OAN52356.1 plasmid stabilization protein [Paramagnetospirillum marisnigri]